MAGLQGAGKTLPLLNGRWLQENQKKKVGVVRLTFIACGY